MSEQQGSESPQGLRRRFGSAKTSRLEQHVIEGAHPRAEPAPEEEAAEEKPAGKKTVWIIVGVAAIVVLILGGVLLRVLRRGGGGGGGGGGGSGSEATQAPASTARPTLPAGGGVTLQFLPAQENAAQPWAGFQTLAGDVNGDGRIDLVWNQAAETNRVAIALANADGSFVFLPLQERPEKRWNGFRTLVGDVNGDGRADLIWNETAETNRVYVALGGADGTLQLLPPQDRAEKRWSGFRTLVGDVNGDGRSDLIWNETAETNRVYVALGNADGSFQFLPAQDHPDQGWAGFGAVAGDVNGDGRADLVWTPLEETGRVAVALAGADGSFQFLPVQDHPAAGQAGFEVLAGDVNGDGRADLVWNARQEINRLIVALGGADGTFQFLSPQERTEKGWEGFVALIADVNGDGRADLVWNEAGANNRTYLGLGTAAGTLEFLPAQDHPETGWEGYHVLAGDVNGDGRADLIWNETAATNRIVVGLSTP